MKTLIKMISFVIIFGISIGIFVSLKEIENRKIKKIEKKEVFVNEVYAAPVLDYAKEPIVYDDMTLTELSEKIERSLNSTVSGYGTLFASYSLEKGVDPYLAVAIMLHETGCKWECSALAKYCNNVGGQKGSPSCNGGAYRSYPTLEDGIKGFIDNLSKNYIEKGLTTPEQIGPKYAASISWASKINAYIKSIKAN